MNNAKVHARNLAANWTGHAASMVVLFFLSPFVIHTLGKVQYGIWSLLTVVTGYMGILDLGVRASTGRHITLYIGKEDHQRVEETIRTSLAFFSTIGIMIVAVGAVLGWIFPSVFSSVPSEYHGLVMVLLPVLALNMWLTTFRSVLASVLIAHDRFDLTNGVDLVMLATRTAATVIVLNAGGGLLGMTLVVVGCNVFGILCTWVLAGRIYRRLRVWPFAFSKARMREILGYGAAAFVTAIAVKIIGQTDLVIVGAGISVADVTVYSVGAMLLYYSNTFIGQISTTFFPPVQRTVARGEMGPARWLTYRQVRLALLCGVPIYVGFILFARPFIRLWMFDPVDFPASAVEGAAWVMVILSVSKLLFLLTVGASSILAAMGHIKITAALSIGEALVNLGLSLLFVLAFGWGLLGVAAGTLAARLFVTAFLLPWYACRKAGMAWGRYIVETLGRGSLAAALFAGICLAVQQLGSCTSWPVFAGQVALSVLGYVPVALLVLVPKGDRSRLVQEFVKQGMSISKDDVQLPVGSVDKESDGVEIDEVGSLEHPKGTTQE